jgi:signal transduction histidine kinase
MLKSLGARFLLASILWTAGLLLLMHLASMLMIHTLPNFDRDHPGAPTAVGVLLMLAGVIAARASLAPLRRLEQKVSAVSRGDAARIEGTHPSEVQPVIDSLNGMIESREKAVTRAYAAAGDLAHCLKTPLALLALEADAARAAGHAELADAIAGHVRRMSGHIDRHLTRARVAASDPTGSGPAPIAPCADALIRTVTTLYVDRSLTITADVPPHLRARIRQEDLEEILGNLLDNACKWARTRVALTATADGVTVSMVVDDDGPGLAGPLRETVLERGVRGDESAPGSGLGLSIVRDLAEHYGGSVALGESSRGGLSARVTLPSA